MSQTVDHDYFTPNERALFATVGAAIEEYEAGLEHFAKQGPDRITLSQFVETWLKDNMQHLDVKEIGPALRTALQKKEAQLLGRREAEGYAPVAGSDATS